MSQFEWNATFSAVPAASLPELFEERVLAWAREHAQPCSVPILSIRRSSRWQCRSMDERPMLASGVFWNASSGSGNPPNPDPPAGQNGRNGWWRRNDINVVIGIVIAVWAIVA